MKTRLLSLAVIGSLFFSTAIAQEKSWGIGFHFGEPLGLTVKKYGGTNMYEMIIGRSSLWGAGSYKYDNTFYGKYDKKDFTYISSGGYAPIALQLHLLRRKMLAEAEVQGLSLFYGLGPQFRFGTVEYSYRRQLYNTAGQPSGFLYERESFTKFDIGFDGVLGVEYTLRDVPITFYVDLTMSMELYSSPFYFWGQGGLGVRYNF